MKCKNHKSDCINYQVWQIITRSWSVTSLNFFIFHFRPNSRPNSSSSTLITTASNYSATFCDNSERVQKYASRFTTIAKLIWWQGQTTKKMPKCCWALLSRWRMTSVHFEIGYICFDNTIQILCISLLCSTKIGRLTTQNSLEFGL